MLNLWNIYFIVPLVLLGGVFHPMEMLPHVVQNISKFNPMFYLVQGVRYSVTGISDVSIVIPVILAFVLAISFYFFTVYLFKIGYKNFMIGTVLSHILMVVPAYYFFGNIFAGKNIIISFVFLGILILLFTKFKKRYFA